MCTRDSIQSTIHFFIHSVYIQSAFEHVHTSLDDPETTPAVQLSIHYLVWSARQDPSAAKALTQLWCPRAAQPRW
jgi:hypothetical protein